MPDNRFARDHALAPQRRASADGPGCPRSAARRGGPSPAAAARRDRPRGRAAPPASAGAIASEVATMQPTMMPKAEPLGLLRHRQRLGQAAGLVELDVDRVVAADQRGKARAVVHALVGADRDRPLDRRERGVVVGRQRLLDQRDAGRGAGGEVRRRDCRRSSPRWRRRSARSAARPRAPRRCARDRPAPPSLILSSLRAAAARAALGHRLRRAERDRVGGGQRLRRGEPGELMDRACRRAWPRDPRTRNRARCARRRRGIACCSAGAVEAERQLAGDRRRARR